MNLTLRHCKRSFGRTLAVVASALALTVPLLTQTPAGATGTRHVRGNDISWPECPESMGIPSRKGEDKPMPPPSAKYVIVGLTNGPGFYPNPCLKRQVRWVKHHHVYAAAYAMTTYPKAAQIRKYGPKGPHPHANLGGKLWNTGYAEATFNLATMEEVGLTSPIVWVDVEPYPVAPWSGSRANNAMVVRGVVKAYQEAGFRVGFYSTQSLWAGVVGSLHYGFPEWRTAGATSMTSALYKCSHYGIQGGHAVMAQWWNDNYDFGVMCPGYGTRASMKRFFTKY